MENLYKTGRWLYGISMAGIGVQHFIYGDFRPVLIPAQWPLWLHAHPSWAYIAGTFIILTGIAICIGQKLKQAALLLAGFLIFLLLLCQTPFLLFINTYSPLHLGLWTDPLKELALAGGALVMAAFFDRRYTSVDSSRPFAFLEKLIPVGKVFFGITMTAFGIDHFLYTGFVATLVPAWIPGPVFWTYFAGVALTGSGLAIIFNILPKLIGLLLAAMLILWVFLLHIPRAIADPYVGAGNEVTSVFEAVAFCGIALVISGLSGRPRR